MVVQKVGQVLKAQTLRDLGGVIEGVLAFSDVEADGYVDTDRSVLDCFTAERTATGVYTLTFTKKFPRILTVVATPLLPDAEATKVDVVSFDTETIVLRWADTATAGAAKNPGSPSTQAIQFMVYFQNSSVGSETTNGGGS